MKTKTITLPLIFASLLCSCGGRDIRNQSSQSSPKTGSVTVIYQSYDGRTLYQTQMIGDVVPEFPESQTQPTKPASGDASYTCVGWQEKSRTTSTIIFVPVFEEYTTGLRFSGSSVTKYSGSAKEVRIPDNYYNFEIKTIASNAFTNTGVTSVRLSNYLETISEYAFSMCGNLGSIPFPETIKSIGRYAFQNCDDLKSITLPVSIEKIESQAFVRTPLETVIYKGTKAQWQAVEKDSTIFWPDLPKITCTDGDITWKRPS